MSLPTYEQPKKSWLSLPTNPVTRLKQSLFFNVQNSPYTKSRDEILNEVDKRHRHDTQEFLELQKAAVDLMAVGELSGTYKTVDYEIPEPEKEKRQFGGGDDDDSDDDDSDEEDEEGGVKAGPSGTVEEEALPEPSSSGSNREGLFRPCSEESYELLSYLPLPFTKPCTVYRTGYVCEAAASVLNALLGFNVVPLTRVTSVKGKLGSLIELDDNAVAAFEYFKANGEENTPEWLNLEIQKLAVVDWLSRNMNRTPGNWYINAATEQIHGNGLDTGYDSCFPYKHPWMFRWNLPAKVTSAPWSEEIRARVVPLLTSKEWWGVASDALYHTFFDNHDDFEEGFWNSQWAIFRGQAYLLLSNLLRKDSTPDDLSRGHPKLMIAYDGGMDKAQRGVELYIEPKVSIYALDDSTRQLLQEENFLGRFSPKDLVEQLSHNGDAPPANESTLESLDPKPYIRTFEAALHELKRLREQVSSRENDVSGDVDQAELAHSRIVLNLQKSVQSTVSEYTDMEQLMAEVSKQTSSLGDKMDRISGQHQKAIASHFLINCYLSFVKKSSCLELERMWKDGPQGQRKCATYVRQLLILSSKIDTVEACRRAQSDIEKFAEKIEKDLLDVFDQAYRNADMLVMKDSADVLTDFNGGTNVIMAFVNQHDFFIAQDKVVAANSEPDEAVLKELADPNNSEPQFDHVTEELCAEVVSVVNTETEIIKRVFKEPVVVLQVFLQRVFAQRIQQRIELFLSSAEAMSTLAYVRSLHLAYNVVSSLVKKLKDFFSSENLDTHDSLAALLDQNFADIFIPHIDKNRYFESEKKSLSELISAALWKFAEFHEKKSSHKEGGLLGRITHSLDNEDNKGIGNFMRNFRDRNERNSTPDSPVPLEPEDGEIKIDVVQMCLKCLAESIQRVLELAHQNEINDCVVSLHDLLIESVGKSYIETGLDDAIVSRDMKTISFVHLKTIRRVLTVIRLMSVVINSVIVPLTDSHGQGRRYIVMQTNNFFTKCEEKINSILQVTLDIVSARVAVLLSKQKKRDFLPKEDTPTHQPTSTCLELISFLTEVHDAGAIFLIEQTLKQFLFHVGIDFRDALLEHLKKFTVSVAGGSVLSMDMANYTKMVNSWGISELSEAFVIVNDLAGIFAAELPMVNSLVKEGPLSKTKPFILKEYLSKRSDYQGGTVNKMFAATNKIQALGMM